MSVRRTEAGRGLEWHNLDAVGPMWCPWAVGKSQNTSAHLLQMSHYSPSNHKMKNQNDTTGLQRAKAAQDRLNAFATRLGVPQYAVTDRGIQLMEAEIATELKAYAERIVPSGLEPRPGVPTRGPRKVKVKVKAKRAKYKTKQKACVWCERVFSGGQGLGSHLHAKNACAPKEASFQRGEEIRLKAARDAINTGGEPG